MINFTKFPPKTFSETFTKNFSGTRDGCTVRDVPKMPHRIFHQIPASNLHLMQPTLKNRNCTGL